MSDQKPRVGSFLIMVMMCPFFIAGFFVGAAYVSLYCGFIWAGWIIEGKKR